MRHVPCPSTGIALPEGNCKVLIFVLVVIPPRHCIESVPSSDFCCFNRIQLLSKMFISALLQCLDRNVYWGNARNVLLTRVSVHSPSKVSGWL
jgi:hypothetical protein